MIMAPSINHLNELVFFPVEYNPVAMLKWVEFLRSQKSDDDYIMAFMGKPTFPINKEVISAALNYWESIDPTKAIDYGHSQGSIENRKAVAKAMSEWYDTQILPEYIIFTFGAIGGLHGTYKLINDLTPGGKIITQFPHYPSYVGEDRCNALYPINIMKTPGYHVTAEAVKQAVDEVEQQAERDGAVGVGAFLFCDPNNPLSTCIGKKEWLKIIRILQRCPNVPIVLDEAYAEIKYGSPHESLMQYAPDDIKNRIILHRSGSKGLSTAGERMAVTITSNSEYMRRLVRHNICVGLHPPLSSQTIYATSMLTMNRQACREISAFYEERSTYISNELKRIGIALPDKSYKPEGSFYVCVDLSELVGLSLPTMAQRILAPENDDGLVQTDEDIAFYLLFEDKLAIMPLSYCGIDPNLCFLRITCSDDKAILQDIISRLKKRIRKVRAQKKQTTNEEILQNPKLKIVGHGPNDIVQKGSA